MSYLARRWGQARSLARLGGWRLAVWDMRTTLAYDLTQTFICRPFGHEWRPKFNGSVCARCSLYDGRTSNGPTTASL